MSEATQSARALVGRQMLSLMALELRRSFLSGRAFVAYGAAVLPVMLFVSVVLLNWEPIDLAGMPARFARVHHVFLLRLVTFLGCASIFSGLFRTEVLDRSLHYLFLVPLRRELLVAGKYAAGVVGAALLFGGSTLAAFLALHAGHSMDVIQNQIFSDFGLSTLLRYVGITMLACAAYGAIFMLMGLLFKNPSVAILVFWGWEWLNFLLPPMLKNLSVIHHLHTLSPLPVELGPFAFVADPPPPAAAVVGLLLATIVLVVVCALRVRRMEIAYGAD